MNANTISRIINERTAIDKNAYKVKNNKDNSIAVISQDREVLARIELLLTGRGYMIIDTDSGFTVC
jgi:hypothetical protein